MFTGIHVVREREHKPATFEERLSD